MALKNVHGSSQNEDMLKPRKVKNDKKTKKPVYMFLKEKLLIDLMTEAKRRGMSRQDLIEKILEMGLHHKDIVLNIEKK